MPQPPHRLPKRRGKAPRPAPPTPPGPLVETWLQLRGGLRVIATVAVTGSGAEGHFGHYATGAVWSISGGSHVKRGTPVWGYCDPGTYPAVWERGTR
jgi:hypothetical protein